MLNKISSFIKNNFIVISIFLLFSLLLFRNPYSSRTLIPNLEPFPDAFYYTTTPRCFLQNKGWAMCRLHNNEIEGIKPVVPPAYSLSLLTAYLVNPDVRTFYFINVLLSFLSLFLIYKISLNFFKDKIIVGVLLLIYITTYFTYWFPTLAMAENLLIPLFLFSILLMQSKVTTKNSILIGLTAGSFYATKFAFAPLTILLPLIYVIKIINTRGVILKNKVKQTILTLMPVTIILFNLVGYKLIVNILDQLFNKVIKTNNSKKEINNSYFSLSYFSKYIKEYSNALVGKSQRFLWDNTPLLEKWISFSALFGLITSFKYREYKLTKIYLILAIATQLLFISTFYVVDIRYVYHFLPILILGFGFFLNLLKKSVLKNKLNFNSFIVMILIIYLGSNFIRLKSAIMINLKYSETPWWYLSQLEMNNYFKNVSYNNKKPILITLASPYLTDNYSNNSYTTLPLNDQQDFKNNMEKIWGQNNYDDLIILYKQKLKENNQVYITNYGVNAANHFKHSYQQIKDNFNLTLVQSGCYNLCNIYQLDNNQ